MWGWAALIAGLALLVAQDLVATDRPSERDSIAGARDVVVRANDRGRRADALARNLAAWHQAAVEQVRDAGAASLNEATIAVRLPPHYVKAGPWQSSVTAGDALHATVRTTDGGSNATGIVFGGGALAGELGRVTGNAGYGGLVASGFVTTTRLVSGAAQADATGIGNARAARVSLGAELPDPNWNN